MAKVAWGKFTIITPWDGDGCFVEIRCTCPYCKDTTADTMLYRQEIKEGDSFATDLKCTWCNKIIDVQLL